MTNTQDDNFFPPGTHTLCRHIAVTSTSYSYLGLAISKTVKLAECDQTWTDTPVLLLESPSETLEQAIALCSGRPPWTGGEAISLSRSLSVRR